MLLSVFDRLILLNILPHEGDYTTLKILRQLREDLSFSEEEHAALQFTQDGTNMKWRSDGAADKEIQIGPKAHNIIADRLKELDKAKKLHEQHMGLYERFVIEENR
jgi:hypothetical protein